MSRPKPKTLLAHTSKQTGKTEEVLAATAIFAVFYDGEPINLRKIDSWGLSTKYVKSSFSNSGHAFNLAERLNKKFSTDLFTVVSLTKGETIVEGSPDGGAKS